MTLRSTNPIVYNGAKEVLLPNTGYDCSPIEALRLLEYTVEYASVLRALLKNPEVDLKLVSYKKDQVNEGTEILIKILKRELGNDEALLILAKIDMNLKMKDGKT